jgi:hypothetical protein
MTEQQAVPPMSGDEAVVREAYAAARELLHRAEAQAEQVRSDADRYARRREQEVELLVAKARRLLEVAERRAAAIESAAGHRDDAPPPRHLRREARHGPVRAETGPTSAAPLPREDADGATLDLDAPDARRIRTDLDRLLAEAIAHAVDRSFATGR